MPQAKTTSLIGTLPSVMGQYLEGADLSNMVWFRTGGPAEVLFRPKNLEDLKGFLKTTSPDLPITLVGVGSNLLIRDKGEGDRTVWRLTWRVGLSLLLFVILYASFLMGWLKPGTPGPIGLMQPKVENPENSGG